MGNQKKHISQADYQRYFNDEMTGQERNAFEKLLQKYPFEAEAMDGLQEIPVDQFSQDMDDLKGRLNKKNQKNNRMVWWAAAATIVILVTSGILWYNLDQGTMAPQVAEHNTTEKSTEKPGPEKEKMESVVPVTKAPQKGKGEGIDEIKSTVESEPKEVSDAEVEDHVEITIVEDDVEETEQIDKKESTVEIAENEISGTKPVSKSEPRPANEVIIVEDATMQNQAFEENVEMEYNFAEPNTTRQAKSLTSGAVQSQINAPTLKAQPMMEEQEFKAWMQSQAVLEPEAEMDSIVVLLNLFVDETGKITKFENANQADQKHFKKARKIIRTGPPWQPAMVNGLAIKSELELKVNFKKR